VNLQHLISNLSGQTLALSRDAAADLIWAVNNPRFGGAIDLAESAGSAEAPRPSLARLGDPFGRQLDDYGVDGFFRVGPVAVIGVEGLLIHKGKFAGFSLLTSYEGVQAAVRKAMADDSVRGVAFEIDSSGGEVAGAFDTAAMIRALSAAKPTIAILTDVALSAAYLLASAARQIVVPATGRAGSIGVVTLHVNYAKAIEKSGVAITILAAGKHKADGNPFESLPVDVASRIKADLEASRNLFAEAVATGRGRRLSASAAAAPRGK
jgi:ClpP class serine protease